MARHKGKYPGSGFVHWGKYRAANTPVNQGMWESTSSENTIFIGRGSSSIAGISTTNQAQVVVNDVLIDLYGLNRTDPDFNPMSVLLPPAPDGLDKRDGTGRYDNLADAIAAGGTSLSQSVINRQDLVLLEVWHEKISDKDVVYPKGLVQYGPISWEGIGLTTGNVVQGYSAKFEGDTATTGRGVLWSTLSDANQAKFIQDPLNNIYSDNGELIQVRARARVIRGLEGSWDGTTLDSFIAGNSALKFSGSTDIVKIQGKTTFSPALGPDASDIFLDHSNTNTSTLAPSYGAVHGRTTGTQFAHEGKAYAIPICLVSRLNQGAYHPLNPSGSGRWNATSGSGAGTSGRLWS
ncbi:MAG: hypothetical protein GY814_03085, partial [Gammaproteobacteria bacterium]|nr:hypothetical protein [Gammaproteobacteria bacterium]